jgi:hypothetical protein
MANSQEEKFAIETVTTTLGNRVSVGRKSEQLASRAVELAMFGNLGFQLVSTLKVEGRGIGHDPGHAPASEVARTSRGGSGHPLECCFSSTLCLPAREASSQDGAKGPSSGWFDEQFVQISAVQRRRDLGRGT